jgi:hypothetical protein
MERMGSRTVNVARIGGLGGGGSEVHKKRDLLAWTSLSMRKFFFSIFSD